MRTPVEYKTALTPKERIKVAFLHYVRGVPQHDLATAFEVNSGRINEACQAIWYAAEGKTERRGYMASGQEGEAE